MIQPGNVRNLIKELCPSQMQNRIKDHSKYYSILNNTLKLMDEISQSMHNLIRATYPYPSSTESLTITINNGQHDKEVLVEYMESFKQ